MVRGCEFNQILLGKEGVGKIFFLTLELSGLQETINKKKKSIT
jgi:hypothetical protein